MTKERAPLTFAGAIMRIAGQLGVARCAAVVGKSNSLVHQWSDDDNPLLPNLEQAFALDAAYLAAGGDNAPILEVYAQRLQAETASSLASYTALTAALADSAKEHGEAISFGLAVCPRSGIRDIYRALAEFEEAGAANSAVVRHLTSLLNDRRGAGPISGGSV